MRRARSQREPDDRERDAPEQRRRLLMARRESQQLLEKVGVRGFAREYRRLLKITSARDFSSTSAVQALQRAQLGDAVQRLGSLGAHDSTKAAYAAVALGGLIRDLSHDIRASGDQSQLIERLQNEVVRATLAALATDVMSRLTDASSAIHRGVDRRSRGPVAKELRALKNDLATILSDAEMRGRGLLQRSLEK